MPELAPLVQVKSLSKSFVLERSWGGKPTSVLKAVDNISFSVAKGEVFGLVGESGCGKTTIGKLICGMFSPDSGQILYDGRDITHLNQKERRSLCTEIQFIFQDPYSSLNPRMTVWQTLSEPIAINGLLPKSEIGKRVDKLLDCVGLASYTKSRYPHEFSGGQRQRIGIARALALNPKFIVCDEPVSALDVSIQAQVLNLLADLKDEFGLTYIFIAHGLNVIKHLSDRVAVMYLGKIMETAPKEGLSNPINPYTKALMSAIPIPDPNRKRERILLSGDVPSPINPGPGCRFASRCFAASPECSLSEPPAQEYEKGHFASCFNAAPAN
ncbi:MAG: ABC transporter ATP-binding protein [Clostridiales bacterium]|nr:ABC transporter ATP-binding protein [Clostridiales bacterium]